MTVLRYAAYTLAAITVFSLAYGLCTAVKYSLEDVAPRTTVSCPTEDSVNCFWDASEQGNGLGQDLWN